MKMRIINVCIINLLYALNNSYMYFLFMLKFEYFDIEYWVLFVICLFVIWNFLTFFSFTTARHPNLPTQIDIEPKLLFSRYLFQESTPERSIVFTPATVHGQDQQ